MEKTLSDLLDAWWLDYRPTIADTTAYNKLGIIRLHILPYCGNKTVSYLKVSDLEYILKKHPISRSKSEKYWFRPCAGGLLIGGAKKILC